MQISEAIRCTETQTAGPGIQGPPLARNTLKELNDWQKVAQYTLNASKSGRASILQYSRRHEDDQLPLLITH